MELYEFLASEASKLSVRWDEQARFFDWKQGEEIDPQIAHQYRIDARRCRRMALKARERAAKYKAIASEPVKVQEETPRGLQGLWGMVWKRLKRKLYIGVVKST